MNTERKNLLKRERFCDMNQGMLWVFKFQTEVKLKAKTLKNVWLWVQEIVCVIAETKEATCIFVLCGIHVKDRVQVNGSLVLLIFWACW